MQKYLLAVLFLALIGCSGFDENKANLNVTSLDPDKAEEVKLSDFVNDIEYVKLSTANDFYIGEIEKILVTDTRIYVLDAYRSEGLFVFDRNGNAIFKIQNYGRGPGEFMGPYDFVLDDIENKIIVYSAGEAKLSYYEMDDGSFIEDKPLNFWIERFEKINDGYVFFLNNRLTKENKHNIIFTEISI